MNRQLTALFAALEALLVVGVGIGIPLVPLTLMWAIQYGLQFDWIVFWRAAVDIWLVGHGTDIRFTLDSAVALSTGLPGAADTFLVSIAPLAFALITVLLGVRAGRRIGETPHRVTGLLTASVVFALLSLGVALTAVWPTARPSLSQGAALPTLVFALGLGIGTLVSVLREGAPAAPSSDPLPPVVATVRAAAERPARAFERATRRALRFVDERMPGARATAAAVFAGGAASAFLVLGVASIALAVLLATHYGQVIALYESVQSGVLGGVALTVGQLALLPNLIIWTGAWLVGPGFALGTGSSVGPLGTVLGPVPAMPILGAIPAETLAYGFVGVLVPVVAGFASGIVFRARLERAGVDTPLRLALAGLGVGIAGGVLLGALSWISGGAAGPGRLVDVGPSWLAVGGWSALEVGVGAVIALVVSGLRSRDVTRRSGEQTADKGDGAAEKRPETADARAADPHGTEPGITSKRNRIEPEAITAPIEVPADASHSRS